MLPRSTIDYKYFILMCGGIRMWSHMLRHNITVKLEKYQDKEKHNSKKKATQETIYKVPLMLCTIWKSPKGQLSCEAQFFKKTFSLK